MTRSTFCFLQSAFCLALATLFLAPLPCPLRGQELPWLLGGQVRFDFAPTFWTWDSRYGLGPSGSEEVELLGLDLTGNPMGSDILPDLVDLEANLAEAMEDPSYRVKLGASQAVIDQARLVFPLRLEVGISDWLTVGGMVPFVRQRQEILFALDADSLLATDGISPFVTDATSVLSFLDALRSTVLDAQASHPEEQAVADAQAYLDALNAAYTQVSFFPVAGSAPGLLLQQRLDELREAFSVLGITGLPETVPLAQEYLDEEAFGDFLGGPVMRAFPLEDWTTLWSMGDVEVTANLRLLRGGFEPDSLGTLPGFRYQVGGGLLVRLGTGDQEDPARFFDQDIGDGQMDLEGNVFGLVELGSRFGAWGRLRYGIQTEGDLYRRITDPAQALPDFARTAPVKRTPGNYLELDLNPRFHLNPDMTFGVRYHLWSKGEDSYTLGDVNPEFQDPATLPAADLLNRETEQGLREVGFSATYSTVAAYARGEASMPLHIRATYFHPVSGSGGQTPKGGRFEAGITIYKTFWGRADRRDEPPEEPIGRR